MTDILDDTDPTIVPLTQEDYDRALKLDDGIKKLSVELEALKDRIKAEHTTNGTFVHGKVIVVRGVQNRVDTVATTKNFPIEDYAELWEVPTEPVFDLATAKKTHKDKIVTDPVDTLSIKFGQ